MDETKLDTLLRNHDQTFHSVVSYPLVTLRGT